MKKVALSLAGVLAAAAFAPEASAVPAFARQTGMACTACHAQHFPVLNGFGRAFKAAGFTMMGAQEKVEGEHMSLPGVLNSAVLMKARYQKTSGTDAPAAPNTILNTTNDGQWQIPDELSLFIGGRVADSDMIKVGMMMENNMVGGPVGGIIAGLRVPIVVDLGAAKLSVIPYITDALGAFYGYTESSTGVTRGIRWAEHRKEISAHQYTGIGAGTASGVALVAHTDMGYINVSRWSPDFAYVPGATGAAMSSTAVHIAVTPTVADWAMVIGADFITGTSYTGGGTTEHTTKGTGFSAQAHGELAGMETGLYASYAVAPKSEAGVAANIYNGSTVGDAKAFAVGADVTVIPHTLTIGVAYRNGTKPGSNATAASGGVTTFAMDPATGAAVPTTSPVVAAKAAGVDKSDNAITITAVYDLFQNVALHANYSMYSGDAYANASAVGANGKSLFTGMLEAAW